MVAFRLACLMTFGPNLDVKDVLVFALFSLFLVKTLLPVLMIFQARVFPQDLLPLDVSSGILSTFPSFHLVFHL